MTAIPAPRHDPERRCRPLHLWPEDDRLAWAAALRPGDALDPGGPASRWAPTTRALAIAGYSRWLAWLDRTGELDPTLPPARQVTPRRVREFVAALRKANAPNTVLFRIQSLAQAAGALAPETDWTWLWDLARRLRATALPARLKRLRLVGSDELFALGLQLMAAAEQDKDIPAWRRAVRYRDGLMIAVLAARPLRLKNFAAIEIGRHLVRHGERYRLLFLKAEMKTCQALELPFPEQVRSHLECYLSHHRPRLCERQRRQRSGAFQKGPQGSGDVAEPSANLWVSSAGSFLSANAIYYRIVQLTRAKFGQPVNPHLFRDCAATSIASMDPERVRITTSVLGHARLATSERAYNHAKALEATRQYQDRIMALRRKA